MNNKNNNFELSDDLPDYVKIGLENAKNIEIKSAPPPPEINPKVSLGGKLKNLSNSINNIISDGIRGKEILANVELIEKRLETCKECPYLSDNKTYCTECGCIVELKAKFKSSTCPKNYWN